MKEYRQWLRDQVGGSEFVQSIALIEIHRHGIGKKRVGVIQRLHRWVKRATRIAFVTYILPCIHSFPSHEPSPSDESTSYLHSRSTMKSIRR